jgi:hypothetical protein
MRILKNQESNRFIGGYFLINWFNVLTFLLGLPDTPRYFSFELAVHLSPLFLQERQHSENVRGRVRATYCRVDIRRGFIVRIG